MESCLIFDSNGQIVSLIDQRIDSSDAIMLNQLNQFQKLGRKNLYAYDQTRGPWFVVALIPYLQIYTNNAEQKPLNIIHYKL